MYHNNTGAKTGFENPLISDIYGRASYYYYTLLSGEDKKVYRVILDGLKNYLKEIRIPARHIDETSRIFNCVLQDSPLVFYTKSMMQYSIAGSSFCTLKPQYTIEKNEVNEYLEGICGYLRALDKVSNRSGYDKELFVHDFCLDHYRYDRSIGKHAYTILGPVLCSTAVCEGIAKFVKLAFDYLDVRSLLVSGKAMSPSPGGAMEGHAWNIIKLDGTTYHLDVTFDLTLTTNGKRYDYFNLSDEDIRKDHVPEGSIPVCGFSGMDYYTANSLSVKGLVGFEKFISNNLERGITHVIVKITDTPFSQKLVDNVIETAIQQYMEIFDRSVFVNTAYNSSQVVFEVECKRGE